MLSIFEDVFVNGLTIKLDRVAQPFRDAFQQFFEVFFGVDVKDGSEKRENITTFTAIKIFPAAFVLPL